MLYLPKHYKDLLGGPEQTEKAIKVTPIVERVILFGLHAKPQSAVNTSIAAITLS